METTLFTTFSRTEPRKRTRTRLPADGRAPRGFTLTELLAVLAIVLVVVVGSIGVWLALAGTVAPGQATAVVQAMLNGARDCAVSGLTYKRAGETTYGTRPVYARVVFSNSYDPPNKTATDGLTQYERECGTKMSLQYWKGTEPPQASQVGAPDPDWVDWPGRGAEYAGRNLFVLRNIPSPFPSDEELNSGDVLAWEEYRARVSKALAEYAFTNVNAAGYLEANAAFETGQTGQDKFYVTFDPTGTLVPDSDDATTTLVIIQLAGQRVGEYEFYVLNANTGTQLVFD